MSLKYYTLIELNLNEEDILNVIAMTRVESKAKAKKKFRKYLDYDTEDFETAIEDGYIRINQIKLI